MRVHHKNQSTEIQRTHPCSVHESFCQYQRSPMCSTRQIRDKTTNSQVFEDRLCVHSYLDLCIINPAAVMQSHARNRLTDNPGILNSSKMLEKDQYIMIPVATCDFAKLNEIAESLMVMKNLQQAEEIKQFRNKLLHVHNCVHCLKFNNSV